MSFLDRFGPRIAPFALQPLELDRRINILDGSVSSGKTYSLHSKVLYACRYPIAGWRFLVGQTKDTVYTNVLSDLFQLIGPSHYRYNHQSGFLSLCGSDWKVVGAKDEGSERLIRGATVGVAVCDEVVLMPERFFKMLLTRMRVAGARLYGTTNPDQPLHWLKTEYLDNDELKRAKLLYHLHCTMDDNPNLPEDYKQSQKALYKGLFYQRFILGQWVMAEGSIYGSAWSDELIFDSPPATLYNTTGHVDHWFSNDYGTTHPHVYLEYWDDGDVIWVTREWVWDSKLEQRQKTDAQYAQDLIDFMGNNGGEIRVPPEAASFRAELLNRGLWVVDADNEVTAGIQTVSALMATKRLRVHRSCKRLLRGIETHVWDPNKAKRGVEEPLKQDDDECDCLRYGLHGKIQRYRWSA